MILLTEELKKLKSNNYISIFQNICNSHKISHQEIIDYIKVSNQKDLIDNLLEEFENCNRLRIIYIFEYFNIFLVLCKIDIIKMQTFFNKIKYKKIFDEYRDIFDSLELAIKIVNNENMLKEKIEKLEMENKLLETEIKYMPGGEGYLKAKENFEQLKNLPNI